MAALRTCSIAQYSCQTAMLQAHSILWHYLWLAPQILTLILCIAVFRSRMRREYPVFCVYLLFAGAEGISLYILDLLPFVSGVAWWRAFWVGTVLEGILKFILIGELLHHLLRSWTSIAKTGRNLVSGSGVLLVLLAATAAAFAAPDNAPWYIGGVHVLSQTIYLAASGLIVSMFVLAACFRIPWDRTTFGIALGAGFVWCEHLAIWALVSGGVVRNRGWEDIANMAAYHVAVLIWCFYLLVPHRMKVPKRAPELPENNLEIWNRELERLIHQ